jgi:hypothetical protein
VLATESNYLVTIPEQMPTRSDVIASLKSKYDAQITGAESALIEPALIKLLIAQLIDQRFGGGGSTIGAATELRQIDGNNYLSLIEQSTAQSLNGLNEILTELRDDIFVNESVWYDRKDVLNFYIRRLTIDQDTQTPIIAWYDKDGNSSSPDVSLLIQSNATSELQTEIINQINAINSITAQIQTNQQNQLASQLTQAQVQAAIQNAADIDAIITRLASIDNKTVPPTSTLPKATLPGFTTVAAINNNLLDPSGLGAWTDARAYQSCELLLVAGANVFGFTALQGSIDNIGTNNTLLTAYNAATGLINTNNGLPPGFAVKLRYDLTGVNYIKIGNTNAVAGNKISGVLNTFVIPPQLLLAGPVTIAGTVPTSISSVVPVASQAPELATDVTAATITASVIGPTITLGLGESYQSTIVVSSITGVLAQSIVRIQESPDNGVSWRTVYTFEPITVANGARIYKSAVIASTANRIRYTETLTGTTPSITRAIFRSAISAPGLTNHDTRSQTTYNSNLSSLDIPAYGVIRAISVMPTVATPLYLQIHDSIAPVAPGTQPRQSIRIPVEGLVLSEGYFGGGRLLGGAINPRVAISTTINTYTQISLAANTLQLYIEAN